MLRSNGIIFKKWEEKEFMRLLLRIFGWIAEKNLKKEVTYQLTETHQKVSR